jgi:hypothetical protein
MREEVCRCGHTKDWHTEQSGCHFPGPGNHGCQCEKWRKYNYEPLT